MNSFKIGDKVIYPNQGIGVIEDIQEKSYYGQTFRIFYVRILCNDTLVLIPSSNTEEVGIRKPIHEGEVEDIFDFIQNGGIDVTMNWKGRYKENLDLMKSGLIINMVQVLKGLFYLNLIKPLSFREKKMMEKAKELVVSEISEVSSSSSMDIEKRVLKTLSLCFKDMTSHLDS
jgi:CarD family transcriptional regulator